MAQMRKLVRITVIADHSILYDAMTLFEGKAVAGSLVIEPVKHGGDDENGALKAMPTPKEFVIEYMASNNRIPMKEVATAAEKAGLTKTAVYAVVSKFAKDGLLKRIDMGIYEVAKKARPGRPAKKTKKAKTKYAAPKFKRKTRRPEDGKSALERIVAHVSKKQNGSGEGVSLGNIKTAMEKLGFVPTGVGPALTSLVQKEMLVRVAPGHYRTGKTPVKQETTKEG